MACRAPAVLVVLAGVLAGLGSLPALGEEPEVEESEPRPLPLGPALMTPPGPWRPPEHVEGAQDWLLLTSGEWLTGNIDQIRDDTVFFDSEELDDLEIDWEDVAELHSARRNTYRFTHENEADVIVTGTAAMRDGVFRVDTSERVEEFPRDDLLAMIEGDLREINYWSLKVSLGFSLRSGNSDQKDLNLDAILKRQTPTTRGFLRYLSAYSVAEGEDLTNNQRLTGGFDYYVSRRFFVAAPIAELFRDRLQNIDLRSTLGAGLGYDVLDRPKVDWNVVLGAGWQRTDYHQIETGLQDPSNDAAVLFNTELEVDPWKDIDWDTIYQLQLIVTDFGKTNHHLTSVFSFEVWGPLDLDVTFVMDRIESPTRDEDGQTPNHNDYRLTVGIGLDL